jgi:hypothetical protein
MMKKEIGITNKACMIIVTAEATSQSRFMKSSFKSIFLTINFSDRTAIQE